MKAGGIILAGGKGSRLGREKCGLEIAGITLLQRVVDSLEPIAGEILIVVKAAGGQPPSLASRAGLRVVEDKVSGKGPLAGIAAGLAGSTYKLNLVVACDQPLLNRGLLEYLVSAADGYEAVIPRIGDKLEPLQGVYSRDCIDAIENLLSEDKRKIDNLFSLVRTRFIEAEEIERFDPQHLSFFNINTQADLEKAEKLLAAG